MDQDQSNSAADIGIETKRTSAKLGMQLEQHVVRFLSGKELLQKEFDELKHRVSKAENHKLALMNRLVEVKAKKARLRTVVAKSTPKAAGGSLIVSVPDLDEVKLLEDGEKATFLRARAGKLQKALEKLHAENDVLEKHLELTMRSLTRLEKFRKRKQYEAYVIAKRCENLMRSAEIRFQLADQLLESSSSLKRKVEKRIPMAEIFCQRRLGLHAISLLEDPSKKQQKFIDGEGRKSDAKELEKAHESTAKDHEEIQLEKQLEIHVEGAKAKLSRIEGDDSLVQMVQADRQTRHQAQLHKEELERQEKRARKLCCWFEGELLAVEKIILENRRIRPLSDREAPSHGENPELENAVVDLRQELRGWQDQFFKRVGHCKGLLRCLFLEENGTSQDGTV